MQDMQPSEHRGIRLYAAAILMVLVAALARLALQPWMGDRAAFVLFTLPHPRGGGLERPAARATAAAFVLGILFAGPRISVEESGWAGTIFLVTAAGIIMLAAAAWRSRARAAQSDRRAEQRAHEAGQIAEEINLLIEIG